jgi:DNA repair exonuclease SbcCD ATPase subunit
MNRLGESPVLVVAPSPMSLQQVIVNARELSSSFDEVVAKQPHSFDVDKLASSSSSSQIVHWLGILGQVIEKCSSNEAISNASYQRLLQTHSEHQQQTRLLRQQYQTLQGEQQQSSAAISALHQQIEAIEVQLRDSQGQHQELSAQHEALQQLSANLQTHLDQIETEKTRIEESLEASNARIESLREEVQALVEQLETERQRATALEGNLSQAKDKYRRSKGDLRRSVADVDALRTRLDSAQEQLTNTEQSLTQAQTSLADNRTREEHLFQFIPSLDNKIWANIISKPCHDIERPVLRAAYLVSAIARYTIYKLYSLFSLRNELERVYRSNRNDADFQQAASLIENRVFQKFANKPLTVQRVL